MSLINLDKFIEFAKKQSLKIHFLLFSLVENYLFMFHFIINLFFFKYYRTVIYQTLSSCYFICF